MLATLPVRPVGLRVLTDPEAAWLKEIHPGLPSSPAQCITCGGAGIFRWRSESTGEPTDYHCPCIDQRVMHRYFLHSGLGLMYQRLSWTDCVGVHPDAMEQVVDYQHHAAAFMRSGRGLILRSPERGTGKTLLAALLFKDMLAQGHDGYFIGFSDLLDSAMGGWRNEEERRWFVRRIRNAGVLVIDDVGRERMRESLLSKEERVGAGTLSGVRKESFGTTDSLFDQVIRARQADAKPTIITTNKSVEEWEQRYSSNILSLVSGSYRQVEVKGRDYRPTFNLQQDDEDRLGLMRPVVVG